jgi:3-dehydroquinate synthase
MHSIEQVIQVTYRYRVHFTQHLFSCENSLLRDVMWKSGNGTSPQKLLCVIDQGVWQQRQDLPGAIISYSHYYDEVIELAGAPLVIEGGERIKNDIARVTALQEAISDCGICRHSYVMAIGGGALLDMVGYAAATAHRGVRLLRVPTTTLAQCDSGVGVKNSMNAFAKKNFLGTFTPPWAVFNDADFLTTLSARDWRSGIAEAIKVALLKDADFFTQIEQEAERIVARNRESMQAIIYRCAQLHLEHIATGGDPFESTSSRPLDFGHWAAHKLEHLSQYTLRHGEAVAIGVALDATYSSLKGWLPKEEWHRVLRLVIRLGFAVYIPELSHNLQNPSHPSCILSGLREFREHLGGPLTLSFLSGIGAGIEVHSVDEMTMIESIALLAKYQTTFRWSSSCE